MSIIVTYNGIENHTRDLVDGFLAGEVYLPELSEKVLSTFDHLDKTSYNRMLEHIKGLLSRVKWNRLNGVFVLTLPYELCPKEKAVLVRFINISYKENENIIILNNNVVYVGSTYVNYDPQKVKDYIENVLAQIQQLYRTKQRRENFNRWKTKLFHSLRLTKSVTVN